MLHSIIYFDIFFLFLKIYAKFLSDPHYNTFVQVLKTFAKDEKMEGYVTKSDLSRRAGVSVQTIMGMIRRGVIPAPTHKVGVRLYYTLNEGTAMTDFFRQRMELKKMKVEEYV